jgi:hypothetical protein
MKKRIIFLLAIVVLVVAILITFVDMKTIYLGSNTKAFVFGNKIIKINRNNKIILKSVYVYNKERRINGYLKSTKEGKNYGYYAVTSNNKIINPDNLIASGKLNKIKVVEFKNKGEDISSSSLNEVNSLLEKSIKKESVMDYKDIEYDIDNDSRLEKIYSITYVENGALINSIFINDNDNVIDIVNYEIDFDDVETANLYTITNLIDFNNDDNYEIVLSKVKGDDSPKYYDIYSYIDGSVKEIK